MPLNRDTVVGTKFNAQAPDRVLLSSINTPPVYSNPFQAVEEPVVLVASPENDAAPGWIGTVQISPDGGVTFTDLILQTQPVIVSALNSMLTISIAGVFRVS